jgi:hypothetical protein
MRQSIEDYADMWEDPERYILVEFPTGPGDPRGPRLHWVEAVTFAIATFDGEESIHAAIVERMRAAGAPIVALAQLNEMRERPQWTDADPQHVAPSEKVEAHHVRLADGRFQRVFRGPDQSLFCGPDHILAKAEVAQLLASAPPTALACVPAVVFDPETGTDRPGYFEVQPKHELAPRALRKRTHAADAEVWHFQHERLFVSPRIAAELRALGLADIVISPGFASLVHSLRCSW